MISSHRLPSHWPGTLFVVGLTVVWTAVRLWAFPDHVFPLTYVLPLMAAVWTRRSWHAWGMALVFILGAVIRATIVEAEAAADVQRGLMLTATLLNIGIGMAVVLAIIRLRNHLDAHNARLTEQNAELEAQAEELAQQNEEIKIQTEELAQQNEEIESQAEELTGQNEELQSVNDRIRLREEILQGLLESTRLPSSSLAVLEDTCRRSLSAIGCPADCVAVLRIDPDALRIKVQACHEPHGRVPEEWPLEGSIAQVVIEKDCTAYVSDLTKQRELAAPFTPADRIRSILATPLHVGGKTYGIVVACSVTESHWTQEQFSVIEWIAAQCGLIVEGIRWQKVLQQRTQELERVSQAKDQFLAMLSHELRTPLTPVLAAAGGLESDERLPADAREDLRMIRRNVSIQSRLIDDLLDLTRLGRGKLDLEKQTLELAVLLRETAGIVAPDLDARSQTLVVEIDAVDGCYVDGDGARLQQVFWNILKNAMKFSPPKARILLSARMVADDPGRVAIDIVDHGLGIAAENIERIFKPFEQVSPAGKQRGSDAGLGLGLAIVKVIVELHQGTVKVSSDGVGHGSTFTIELPLVPAPEPRALPPAPTAGPSARHADDRKLRILLVEDHVDTGRVLARLLRSGGYEVEHADCAAAALELFLAREFDLVISDLGLPDESGLVLMKRLREIDPEIDAICLSGYGMEDDLQACREAGFTEHLTKPVDVQRLRASIRRISTSA